MLNEVGKGIGVGMGATIALEVVSLIVMTLTVLVLVLLPNQDAEEDAVVDGDDVIHGSPVALEVAGMNTKHVVESPYPGGSVMQVR